MTLAEEYRRQRAWRSWPLILDALPLRTGQTVLDLGCGVGDLAGELTTRGARVIGVDLNAELLEEAWGRGLAGAEFRLGDLRMLPDLGVTADGIWCSFGAAYFIDLGSVLASWRKLVAPGGWIALTEIDDLFGHQPLDDHATALIEGYVGESLAAGRYDFRMGRKLRGHLERAGFRVTEELTVPDRELAFDGAATPDVVDGWRRRFARMSLLQAHCGDEFDRVRDAFLATLVRADHRSTAKVVCCVATA